MTIPPFPSQDLAKLVLGYLAEEQLMTAYDEFLQASPYLDALRNEYDRIFMTSLRSILAEYRAVKISVETCKPIILRKRLIQCSNLLEVVKFLINHVDVNKLKSFDTSEKSSLEKQNTSTKSNCEVCNSLKLPSCTCIRPQFASMSHHSEAETSSSPNSIEATPLTDLPGNYGINRKKYIKTLDKESSLNYSISSHQVDVNGKISYSSTSEQSLTVHNVPRNSESTTCTNSSVKPTETIESRPKIEEFNDVFESVVKRNSTISGSQIVPLQKVSNANTFRDFESGVSASENQSANNVPDSSTSENVNVQSFTKDYNENMKAASKCQLLLQVSNVNDNIEIQTCRGTPTLPAVLPRMEEQKIKILSDVKVGRKLGDEKKPLHYKNATSTPLMQMQTIVINGTPAYKHNAVNTYTKDEIMAMPTLIVVPSSGSSKNPTNSHVKSKTSEKGNVASNLNSPSSVLGPLVIDVPNSPDIQKKPNALSDLKRRNIASSDLIKTVDFVKNASVPKDNGATTTVSTNTPQGLPPARKSSSTPRRSSHVRVLDFTTPRRILHETISEQVTTESTETSVEVVLSGSPSITNTFINKQVKSSESSIITYTATALNRIECIEIDDEPKMKTDSGNKIKPKGKRDWDADLRALAVASDNAVQSKPKPKKPKKKKDKSSSSNKEKTVRKQISPKGKKTKRKRKVEEDDDEPMPDPNRKPDVPVKPNINIISAYSEETQNKNSNENVTNKSDEKDDCIDTPEADRLSLQNVIGAKLNISDLLETPYKQALYDIQMGTPRFLGPDLPDEPMSDVKIMNIPTPRFLNTPKAIQATPSSYSSRPTDYSSGGSYYKPDDQDYILVPDLNCPVTSSKDEKTNTNSEKNEGDTKKSRPVRQCTKNVSYKTSGTGKSKRTEDNTDTASSCSDSFALNSTTESKNEKENVQITPVNNKSRSRVLSESNKKVTVKKRPSTSTKDKSKTIIKIKSRQTPTKLTPGRRRKVSEISKFPSPNKLARKPTLTKEKQINTQPLVTLAPTKSRRKSSSPRKLHRTKTYSSNFRTCSPDTQKPNMHRDNANSHDSDTEQLALRWSDDGSQDAKAKEHTTNVTVHDSEDISQIKEFIQTTNTLNTNIRKDGEGSLQADLIRRGFDVETAKIIERDLLDTPQVEVSNRPQVSVEIVETKESPHEKTVETDVSSVNNELQIVQDDDEDDIELSVHECNEDTTNYFTCEHDYTKEIQETPPITLRDKFSIELCIDEDLTVRLRANTFAMILDQDPIPVDEVAYANSKETEMAVRSICNIYTPIKECIKAQCFEIFDSTLTSLDTPLKTTSPKGREYEPETTVTDIVLEDDKIESKDKPDTKKRKRSIPDNTAVEKKKIKHDTPYLFNSTNIQNIDIESVLKKLHGPT